jgi:resuscitation-promoting factor RpfB
MWKKYTLIGAGVFLAVGLALVAAALLPAITITDQGNPQQVRTLVWTAGQALRAAGVQIDPADRVTPGIQEPLLFRRAISIQRAAHITLWDAGKVQSITGFEGTAGALLAQARVILRPGDRLSQNGREITLEESIPPGQPVVLQLERAQTLTIDENGKSRQVTTLGPTAARALWEAGIRPGPADRLSINPAALIGDAGTVAYLPAHPLTIQAAGQQITTRSTAETVGQALAEAGVALQGLDYSRPAEDQPLPEDGLIQVVRVQEEINLKENLVPYGSKVAPDPDLELDQSRVTVAGQYGINVSRERVRYEDGQEVSRGVDSEWTASLPVDQTLGFGTKVVVKTLDVPGGPIEYYRAVQVYATSYSPCRLGTGDGRCGSTTASGAKLTKGIIAVRLSWYRMFAGQRVYVPGYGYGVIGDVGGGMPDRYWIDLGFDEDTYQPIVGWTTLYFLTPVPANVPWALP